MTIQMVEGIHTHRRDWTTHMRAYSPRGKEVKPFSSFCKKIADDEEEKRRSQENKSSNPFTPVREDKSRQKRSRKYRQLGMGCSVPSNAVSMCSTTTTTTSMATLSASVPTSLPAHIPSGPPSTSNTLFIPKLQMQRPPLKSLVNCHPTPTPISPPLHSDWSSDEDQDSAKQKERERIS